MDKQDYYDLKKIFSIIQHITKMVGNVSEILEIYPNIENMPLKDVKEYLMNRHLKFNKEFFNKFKESTNKK